MVFKFYIDGKFRGSCGEGRFEEVKRYFENKYPNNKLEIEEVRLGLPKDSIRSLRKELKELGLNID